FIALTDHSYDLSCSIKNYLKEDKNLERWKSLMNNLNEYSYNTIFLAGEEISCKNSRGEIVHLLALNNSEFIAGSSDGARRDLLFKEDKKIYDVISSVHRQKGIVFAAHPASHCTLLERLLLKRGYWNEVDLSNDIDGIQFFNSGFDKTYEKGKMLWLKMLNKGNKIPLIAGNDSHGDFNRYRAIKFPFVSIYEDFKRFMGYGKTGIYGNCKSKDIIISNIKEGKTFISTGPYISINSSQNPLDNLVCREKISSVPEKIYLHLISSEEYGSFKKVSLFEGINDPLTLERKIFEKSFNETLLRAVIPVEKEFSGNYLRAELETLGKEGETAKALTSCCWFKS
ncbi:MAG: hypothetical protein N2053_02310, partial [Chitinispirillaceae bacterium]|nr:hypothetical protein [Chitinispirillaceae bacterium]